MAVPGDGVVLARGASVDGDVVFDMIPAFMFGAVGTVGNLAERARLLGVSPSVLLETLGDRV
ncbi:hypothetical protein BKA24_001650 [Microbacterium marinum]|uniref:Uncharacterized protein n=1 Tax=Microbacterium marinum TaxID=421115 RepID=A0A7W7BQF6_9MICO|nr:hypothetical protein [Microbacterium marinum]